MERLTGMFYLGIDGGGTTTRCALGDDQRVLATSVAGGSNVVRAGEEQAKQALHAVVGEACAKAEVSPERLQSVCIGAAGAAREDVAAVIRRILGEIMPAPVQVVGDMVIALHAAFGYGPGVIVIAGTGSIAYGRDTCGNIARAGGWGFAISDEGSGQWIGRQAVSDALRAHDTGTNTVLTSTILKEWGLDDLDELVHTANGSPPPEFPRLFPIVLKAAEAGDTIADQLLQRAGAQLAGLAAIVVQRLMPRPPYVPVAVAGGVFRESATVRRAFRHALRERFEELEIMSEPVEPVEGALAMARKINQG